jgi:hypothetical protein
MGTGRGDNLGKPSYFNLPPDIGFTLFTPIKGRIDSLTVYIYKAETCTNILRGPEGGFIYMYDNSKRLSMPLLDNYSP